MISSELHASTYEIALLSREQMESKNKAELSILAKGLGLKGYSRLKKSELIDLVFNASDVMRQAIISDRLAKDDLEKEKARQKELEKYEDLNADNVFTARTIENIANKFKKDPQAPENTAKILFDLCLKQDYAKITIAKEQSKRLRLVLDDMLLNGKIDYEFKDRLYKEWNKQVKHIHVARRMEDEERVTGYAKEAEKVINSSATESAIKWALDNLHNDKRIYLQSIALSILSGRRMVEIHGDLATYSRGEVGVIITGLAKKSTDDARAEFVPLCDVDDFLETINSYSKRGYTSRQVNKNIGGSISKQFPDSLKDLGIEKYKDCRDFYAGVMYESFKLAGAREPKVFTKHCMGHDSEEATNYYRKFQVEGISDEGFINRLKSYMAKPVIS